MKKQTDIAKKQYQGLDKVHGFDKEDDEAIKNSKLKKYKELDLVYKSKFSFYKYCDINIFRRNSIDSKYNDLGYFHRDLDKFNILEPRKECTKEKKN